MLSALQIPPHLITRHRRLPLLKSCHKLFVLRLGFKDTNEHVGSHILLPSHSQDKLIFPHSLQCVIFKMPICTAHKCIQL